MLFRSLTHLPPLNVTLTYLDCSGNQLKYLPPLNKNLERLYCYNNRLIQLPQLNETLKIVACFNNPLDVLNCKDTIDTMRRNIKTLHNFRHLYYCLKFKNQFRTWLWERVREPKIALKYHPSYLEKHLIHDVELDNVIAEWIGDD